MTTPAPAVPGAAPPAVEARAFTLRQRFLLWSASALSYLAIRTIGPTLRLSVSLEDGAREHEPQHPSIYCFWHRCVFPATYCFRNHRIAVMTSRSFDGEYIARIIERAGYTAVRGSSSRGGAGALLGMHDVVESGYSVAFTADGPRGPRYAAKPGPVLLARNTGVPIVAFYIALDDAWLLPSWDEFMLPKPFSRGLLRISRPLWVPRDAEGEALATFHSELQQMLDRTRIAAEEMLARGEHRRLPLHRWTR